MNLYNNFFEDDDIVCLCTIPAFEGRKQRFVKIADLKVNKWIRFMGAANANNSNIYLSVYSFLQPQRTEIHVVPMVDKIFLDFDDTEAYKVFRNNYIPALTINTSPGKFQCFIKLSEPISKYEAKDISRTLSRQYGADHTFDLARVFRLPGFRNVKYKEKPLVKIIELNPEITYQSYNLPCDKDDLPKIMQSEKFNSDFKISRCRSLYDYAYFLEKAPLKINGDHDYSSSDLSYAIYLFSHTELSKEEVKELLILKSPYIEQRKRGGLEKYLEKTVERAYVYSHSTYKPLRNRC